MDKKLFYAQSGHLRLRPAELDDVVHLKDRLRDADVREIYSSHRCTPEKALIESYLWSNPPITMCKGDKPIAMLGVAPSTAVTGGGCVWLLGTDEIDRQPVAFVKLTSYCVETFLDHFTVLFNWVDARNAKSLGWLDLLGAEIEPPQPWGAEQEPFCHFKISRNKEVPRV